jgi:hypothetical protein
MAHRSIRIRRGDEDNLPTLELGEPGFCNDTLRLYIGTESGNQLVWGDDDMATYRISDLDTGSSPQYFGYVDKEGRWYIMELNSTEARYCKGPSDYETSWNGRYGLTYGYYRDIF